VLRSGFLLFLVSICIGFAVKEASAEGLASSHADFFFKDNSGKMSSAKIIRHYYVPNVHPSAKVDPRIDPRLRRAASIAQERANARTKARCWRYVKQALVAAGVVDSYPQTEYARDAGEELVRSYGFKRLPMRDPYAAPLGAVIVYRNARGGAGHVELRTQNGFVSDYASRKKCYYPLLAIYGK